jgi:subtilisin family serine protease
MASRIAALFTALLAATAPLADAAAVARSGSTNADQFMGVPIANVDATNIVPNAYIVVYNNTFSSDVIDAHQLSIKSSIKKRNLGKRSLKGKLLSTQVRTFSMSGWRAMALETDDLMMMEINSADEVAYVEADAYVKISTLQSQSNAPSGLVRLSQKAAATTTTPGYVFDTSAGTGITAYIVDTGILVNHTEFQGRATLAFNAVNTVVCVPPELQAQASSTSSETNCITDD